jgi:hypothetical protein
VEDDKAGNERFHSLTSHLTPGRIALSDPERAEALADSLGSQFQPGYYPSDPAVIEKVEEARQAYSYAPASEPKLTIPVEVQDAIRP